MSGVIERLNEDEEGDDEHKSAHLAEKMSKQADDPRDEVESQGGASQYEAYHEKQVDLASRVWAVFDMQEKNAVHRNHPRICRNP